MIVRVDKVYFQTDFEVCLWQIKSVDKEWKALVENKANAVHALADIGFWRFVPGEYTPLDTGTSKGDFAGFGGNVLFWNGPSFC